MDHNLKRFNSTPLEYLSEEQMGDIHAAALDILKDCGTVIHHEKSIDLQSMQPTYSAPEAMMEGIRVDKEKVRKIKESHQPQPLLPEVDAEIEKVLERAKK